ncbi:MAG: DSBA oxidoreductase family protein [Candidatus Collierbacteria bacterium GW2011_GWF2_44_15]|uniref:DSBA oxidoreductase family protein n=2 Tax=Candidatus Collieribacteriota TaxID=1752725 RepID=A0A0G1HH52_9BACT|nr:MAG: DSBA oxidoreductase family protein [Candidatus Collierbacteria bacterium GW2011_GWA1_44_12]KKT46601.1 MAG: DSBA oxidoreductase family protein [Candidatus Collierbacteria bacterium GW2011_GWF2_44_15]
MPKIQQQLQTNTTPLLVLLLVGAAFFIGRLSAQVETLKNGNTTAAQPQAQVAGQQQPQTPTVSIDQIKDLFKKNLVTFGDAKRKILFVEVSDPSCPYCHAAAGLNTDFYNSSPQFKPVSAGGTYKPPVQEIKKLVDEGKASFVWIYQNGHGNGEVASRALYCANDKGKFWEAHDMLFTGEGYKLINEVVKNDMGKSAEMAAFLKSAVDEKFIKDCLDSGKYNSRLGEDASLAASLGVSGTPGFFVNETNYPGAVSFSDMETVVNAAL